MFAIDGNVTNASVVFLISVPPAGGSPLAKKSLISCKAHKFSQRMRGRRVRNVWRNYPACTEKQPFSRGKISANHNHLNNLRSI
jgi:hypothetical protein